MTNLLPAGYGGPSDRPRFPNPIPKLEEPPHISGDTSMRDTPDMSGDLDHRLKIETSEEEYEDSLLSDTSSEADEIPKSQRGLLRVVRMSTPRIRGGSTTSTKSSARPGL
jgi:hypothetical protein